MKTHILILSLFFVIPVFAKTTVSYGSHDLQEMDIYLPANPTNAPVMLYVHGGGWMKGDKSRTGEKVMFFTSQGFIFISANYRLLPDGKHPNNVDDVAQAIAWVHDHITNSGGNPDRIYLMGHSAGAHLVALVATNESPLKKFEKPLTIIKGVISLDTQAYDLPQLMKKREATLYAKVFSRDPAVWRAASPVTHVKAGKEIPPFLICYSRGMGARPNPERGKQADAFAETLRNAGVSAKVIDASDRDHGEINQWFGRKEDDKVTGGAMEFLGLP